MKERPILMRAQEVRALIAGTKTQHMAIVKPQPPIGHAWAGWCVTSTRRADEGKATWAAGTGPFLRDVRRVACPYGQPGDRLWVRETWEDVHPLQVAAGRYSQEGRAGIPGPPAVAYRTIYRADGEYPAIHHDHPDGTHVAEHPYRALCIGANCLLKLSHYGVGRSPGYWTPSSHMPRWASRLTLEITGVRVELLQVISEADAISEGVTAVSSGGVTLFTTTGASCFQTAKDAYAALWESINGPGSWNANPWVWVIEFSRVTQ